MDVVISARVPEDELRILKDKHVNISEVVRVSIIEAAERAKLAESEEALEKASTVMKKIDKKSFLKAVRDDRDESH